jgi:predicted ArsR family transcriptional regulator
VSKKLIKPSPVRARENLVPTSAQLECLRAHYELERKLGRSPSIRELSAALGMSPMGAQAHVTQLVYKGLLHEEKELRVVGRSTTPTGEKWLATKLDR